MEFCSKATFQLGVQEEDSDGVCMVIVGTKWLPEFVDIDKVRHGEDPQILQEGVNGEKESLGGQMEK